MGCRSRQRENNNDDFDLTVEVTTIDGSDSASISQTLHVDVNAVNDAVNDLSVSGQSVAENAPAGTVVGTLTASDIDANESFTYEIVDGNGNAVQDANFEIVGDEIRVKDGADLNYEASSSHQLNIRVTDSAGAQHIESITIDVTDVNESPDTQGENYTVHEDHSVTGNVLQNDSDVDRDNLTVSSYSQPANGSVTIDAKGDFQYQPDANFSGSDSFTYTVSDGNGGFATESVTIEVEAQADNVDLELPDTWGVERSAIPLNIQAMVSDTDGSESITEIVINGLPQGASLSAGTENFDGSWSLSPADLTDLSVTPAFDSTQGFDLTIAVTTMDGTDSATTTGSLHVDVDLDIDKRIFLQDLQNQPNDPVEGISGASQPTEAESNEQPTMNPNLQPTQEIADTDPFGTAPIEPSINAGDDVWQSDEWSQFDFDEAETNDDTADGEGDNVAQDEPNERPSLIMAFRRIAGSNRIGCRRSDLFFDARHGGHECPVVQSSRNRQ